MAPPSRNAAVAIHGKEIEYLQEDIKELKTDLKDVKSDVYEINFKMNRMLGYAAGASAVVSVFVGILWKIGGVVIAAIR